MSNRYVGGVSIGIPDSTTIGTNAQGKFTTSSLVQTKNIVVSSGAVASSYGGTPTANATSATYALVGGGQSGATNFSGNGTIGADFGVGGGGGEVLQGTITPITAATTVTITIGGGGTAPASTTNPGANGNPGANSTISGTGFSTVTARGGGLNPGNYTSTGGYSGNGNAGGAQNGSSGGSGGGAGGAAIASSASMCGQGGPGVNINFGAAPSREFGGGGACGDTGGSKAGRPSAGLSGGAAGVNGSTDAIASGFAGIINTGGGGGGHGFGSTRAGSVSGNGGSGRALMQVLIYNGTTTYYTPAATGTYTTYVYLSGANAYAVYDFTGSGTLTF
jgi:hypothetical protein